MSWAHCLPHLVTSDAFFAVQVAVLFRFRFLLRCFLLPACVPCFRKRELEGSNVPFWGSSYCHTTTVPRSSGEPSQRAHAFIPFVHTASKCNKSVRAVPQRDQSVAARLGKIAGNASLAWCNDMRPCRSWASGRWYTLDGELRASVSGLCACKHRAVRNESMLATADTPRVASQHTHTHTHCKTA